MRKFKELRGKEKAEYVAIILLLPLFLLFRQLGKNIKWLSLRKHQLTACALCAALILGALPLTAFADNVSLTVVTEFTIGKNKINVKNSPDNSWAYGYDTSVVAKDAATLPSGGWTWALQSNLSTAEYTIKLKNYNSSYIIASNVDLYSGNRCKLTLDLSGYNTVTSSNYGLRLGFCDVLLTGDGNLTVKTADNSSAFEANSLTVDLPSYRTLDITAAGTQSYGSTGISVLSNFTLRSGMVNVDITGTTDQKNYGAVGIEASTVTVDSGSLKVVSSNTNENGASWGIRGNSKYNNEKNMWEYPAEVSFNNGLIDIKADVAADTLNAPKVADGLKLWAGKAADRSDKEVYDPEKFQSYTYFTTEHVHCKCGAMTSHKELQTCSYYRKESYQPWTDSTAMPGSGTFYLKNDVVLSSTWEISGTVNICLNGHSIIAGGDFDAIKITDGSLTLSDCSPADRQGNITHAPGTVGRGIVTKEFTRYTTALKMFGGNITGNSGENGAGIYCGTKANVTIKGGTITNNTATENGGGLYCAGDASLDGGTISGNSAKYGGGIYITKGNVSDSVYDAFEMTGGTVTENTATESGGGVYDKYRFVLRGFKEGFSSSYDVGDCTAVVQNNTSGPEGAKITDNVSFSAGQCLHLWNNFTGGYVSLHLTGEDTTAAIPYTNLTSTFRIIKGTASTLHCDDRKFMPQLDASKNKIVLVKALKTLSAADFEFTPPSGNLTYDGQTKTAAVTAKAGINCGKITVKYYDENHERVYEPKKAGTYTVSIDLEENETYAELTDVHAASWKFTITPKDVSASEIEITGMDQTYLYTGVAIKPTPTVTVDGNKLTLNKDYTVTYENNTNIGTAGVTVTLSGDYRGSRKLNFSITYGHASELMYTLPAANENGWYNGDVVISAKNGFTISETAQSFSDSLVLTGETARGGKQIFLKAASGEVYRTVISYKIDRQAPTDVKIRYNESEFKSLLNRLTFGLFFKNTVKVETTATDALSGIDQIQYFSADAEVQNPENITGWENSLTITAQSKKIIYVKVTDKAGNRVILLDQGVVVYSDSAVSPAAATFDLKDGNRKDIDFTISFNGNTFRELRNGETLLVSGNDYTVSGNTITVSKEYFARFGAGTVQNLTFVFDPLGERAATDGTVVAAVRIIDSTHVHNAVKHPANAATCTKDGNIEYYTCTGCNERFKDAACTQTVTENEIILKALNHEGAVLTDAVTEQCTTDGNLAYWYCAHCNRYFADRNGALNPEKAYPNKDTFTKKALGHDFTEWYVTSPATFTEKGEKIRACNRCNKQETEEIAKLVPTMTKGQNGSFTQKKDSSLTFGSNLPLDENAVISVDGNVLPNSAYRLASKSDIILSESYLNKLSAGNHTLSIQTADGTVKTAFTVVAAKGNENPTTLPGKSPKTGDSRHFAWWIVLLISGLSLTGVTVSRKKKKSAK